MKISASEAAQRFAGLEQRLREVVRAAETRSLRSARYELEQASRGTLSPSDLRRLDHPYARRHSKDRSFGGSALRDPAILNQRTGRLARSWRLVAVKTTKQGTRGSVINRAPSAKWIKSGGSGASKMVTRPIIERVRRRIRRERKSRLRSAMRLVLKEF